MGICKSEFRDGALHGCSFRSIIRNVGAVVCKHRDAESHNGEDHEGCNPFSLHMRNLTKRVLQKFVATLTSSIPSVNYGWLHNLIYSVMNQHPLPLGEGRVRISGFA